MLNSKESYGDIVTKAMQITDSQEVGATYEGLEEQFAKIFCEAIEGNAKKGVLGKYYIWIRVQKDAYAANALHLYPMCRRTRPSPYETEDHYLWQYDTAQAQLSFCWCIPRKEITAFVLANPNDFDADWVRLLKKYKKGELDWMYMNEWHQAEKDYVKRLLDAGSKVKFKDFTLKI